MAATDYAAIKAAAETALAARLSGARGYVADYMVRGRSVRYMNLAELQEAIDWASRKIAAQSGKGPFAYGVKQRAQG